MQEKTKTRSKIGPFSINGEIFNTLDDICKKLSEQFSTTYSSPDANYRIENSQNLRIQFTPYHCDFFQK